MTEEMALEYESLIRAAFNCGRYGVAGANADIYRGLEREAHLAGSEEGGRFELGLIMGRVVAYIENALKTVQKSIQLIGSSRKRLMNAYHLLCKIQQWQRLTTA